MNKACIALYDEIEMIKKKQQEVMVGFFQKLYVELDLEWCEEHLGELFDFLKTIQPELKVLYKKLLDLYVE